MLVLSASYVGASLLDHYGLYMVSMVGNQMRLATITAIYRKSLRLSSYARYIEDIFKYLNPGPHLTTFAFMLKKLS
jgi:hypothetical protein